MQCSDDVFSIRDMPSECLLYMYDDLRADLDSMNQAAVRIFSLLSDRWVSLAIPFIKFLRAKTHCFQSPE